MELTLAPNPLHNHPQVLTFEKIATLIGGNGSGKSCILQSIFDTKLNKTGLGDLKVICFSSGQNESFSSRFSDFLTRERRAGETLSLECFYYDKSWAKLLIFLATSMHSNGKVREFLRTNNYLDETVISNDRREDVSTRLSLHFKVDKRYAERVQRALNDEESGEVNTLRATPYFRSLESFVTKLVDREYDFEAALRKRQIELSANALFSVSFTEAQGTYENEEDEPVLLRDDPTVSFFTQAADNDYFIDKTTLKLKLKDDLELDQLSDGEYQMLFLYSLLDLFDDENALFLLDEIDSHLHYKNIEYLWSILKRIKGNVITTTHLLDSITANDFRAIKVVEKGQIRDDDKLKQLIARLSILSRATSVEYEVCAKINHMALLDDYNDWDIFLRLAVRKGLDISCIESVYAFKKSSSYANENESFGQTKIKWVSNLSKVECDLATTQIFLICDRDEATLDIDPATGVKVRGAQYRDQINAIHWPQGVNASVHLLVWKRREIKNYLLSYTALSQHNKLDRINGDGELGPAFHLALNDPADNDGIRRLSVKDTINPLINGADGLCPEKLQIYIDLIPPEEISEDIENMYNFIVSKL
jgi:AAA15 family ATPase/GTPase